VHPEEPHYRHDLAYIHHQGYGFHADSCAPGILALLEPIRQRGGLVLEIGCGSGLLTKYLVAAGHRVIATDASPAMLALATEAVPGAEAVRLLVLPDDPVPAADAIVGIGHALNYLPDLAAIHRGLGALADAIRPGGLLAVDLCDLEWGATRRGGEPYVRIEDDWVITTTYHQPSPDRYDRHITTFVRTPDGSFRRDEEYHGNVLVDTSIVPARLREHGVAAVIGRSFNDEDRPLPVGLMSVIGSKIG
jgi:SAM-dependent methyltransferase